MKPLRLVGTGAFTGFGLGQLAAWMMLHRGCSAAPGLVTLSTFGIGMTGFGLAWTLLSLRTLRSS